MKDFRIATVIFNAPVGCTQTNLERMVPWVRQARRNNARLICFPELSVTGYTTTPEINNFAEAIPGPAAEFLAKLAATEKIIILAGLAERRDHGRVYATHLVAQPNGKIGTYRKLHIAPPEQSVFTPADALPVFNTAMARFGIQLCYDAHFPELTTAQALRGAEIIFIPHASPRGTPDQKFQSWMRHLPARAFDNGLFIVACNQVGPNGRGLDFPGMAVVVGPSGNVIAKTVDGREQILFADLKSDMLDHVRSHRMRFFLPHRREDLFSLTTKPFKQD